MKKYTKDEVKSMFKTIDSKYAEVLSNVCVSKEQILRIGESVGLKRSNKMTKLTSYVIIKREIEFDGRPIYRAYFRGTTNRVRRETGLFVSGYTHKSDLLFDLKNNPMERGVIK